MKKELEDNPERENYKRIHYCKGLKYIGKPIIVIDDDGNEMNTDRIEGFGHWRMIFNNAKSREKRSGATTILEVWD